MYTLSVWRPAWWAGPFTLQGQVIILGLMCGRNYCIRIPVFKSLKLLHMHSQNGWDAEMFFALQWSCFSLNCIFVLLCTCWQHWSSYHCQEYLIRIIWFNVNLRQFQLQMYPNLQILLHPVSETEYVDKLKTNLLQIWTGEVYLDFCRKMQNKILVVFLNCVVDFQACVPQAVTVNKLTPLGKYSTLCISYRVLTISCSSTIFLIHAQVMVRKKNVCDCYVAFAIIFLRAWWTWSNWLENFSTVTIQITYNSLREERDPRWKEEGSITKFEIYCCYYCHSGTQETSFSWALALYGKRQSCPTVEMIWVQIKTQRKTLLGQT